jgi:hypothetical protein
MSKPLVTDPTAVEKLLLCQDVPDSAGRKKWLQVATALARFNAATNGLSHAANAYADAADELLAAAKQVEETQMSYNLQYLQLQHQMQNESRQFTAISNILKTKHDTVKNSIQNVR